jgi:DNA-binding Lrp family transcriptional regulator
MDEVDRKLISQLQLDGRITLIELSRALGYTSMGTGKRLKNLLKRDIIKVSALLNIERLNLCAAIVLLEIESVDTIRTILERFKDCPRVVQIFTAFSGYNLIALIVAEDQDTLESISMEKCSLRSGKGIRRSEFCPVGKIHYSPFLLIKGRFAKTKRQISPCNVDCGTCERHKTRKCVGCPTTRYYHGSL